VRRAEADGGRAAQRYRGLAAGAKEGRRVAPSDGDRPLQPLVGRQLKVIRCYSNHPIPPSMQDFPDPIRRSLARTPVPGTVEKRDEVSSLASDAEDSGLPITGIGNVDSH
jgi:hypothetical protein